MELSRMTGPVTPAGAGPPSDTANSLFKNANELSRWERSTAAADRRKIEKSSSGSTEFHDLAADEKSGMASFKDRPENSRKSGPFSSWTGPRPDRLRRRRHRLTLHGHLANRQLRVTSGFPDPRQVPPRRRQALQEALVVADQEQTAGTVL
jgi:hypothetical protein